MNSKNITPKILAVALLLVIVFSVTAFAQPTGRPVLRKLFLSAKGILINSNDPMDIHSSKIIAAKFKLAYEEINEEINFGILYFDKDKYKLKDIKADSESFYANIYDSENVLVGTVSLAPVDTPDVTVWAGSIGINDTTYNAYYLQYKVIAKPVQMVDSVAEYCKEHPDDEKCYKFEKCKENPEECKEEIIKYCKANPESEKCRALWNGFCLRNPDDARCKEYLKEKCEEDPTQAFCTVRERAGKAFITATITRRPEKVDECQKCKRACLARCVPGYSEEPNYKELPVEAGKCLRECVAECEACKPQQAEPTSTGILPGYNFCERCKELCTENYKRKCEAPYQCLSREEIAEKGCKPLMPINAYDCEEGEYCAKCPLETLCPAIQPVKPDCPNGIIVPKYDEHKCLVGYECKQEACVCPEIYEPVCGTDGKTYGNACEARCAGVGIAYKGKCGETKRCEEPYKCMTKEAIREKGCEVLANYSCPQVKCEGAKCWGAEPLYCAKCPEEVPIEVPRKCEEPYKCVTKEELSTLPANCVAVNWMCAEGEVCVKCPVPVPIETEKKCPEPYKCYPRDQLPSAECLAVSGYTCPNENELCVRCPEEVPVETPEQKLCEEPYKCLTREQGTEQGCELVEGYTCETATSAAELLCYKCPETPVEEPTSETTGIEECKELYWFDNNTRECGFKKFCGAYMYEGLRTFETKEECEKALKEAIGG